MLRTTIINMAKVTPVTTLLHLREHFAEVDVEPGWLFFQVVLPDFEAARGEPLGVCRSTRELAGTEQTVTRVMMGCVALSALNSLSRINT
jgi:hypothetical protein